MTIVINAQLINMGQSYRGAGVSQYSRYLLQSMGAIADRHRIVALVNDTRFRAEGIECRTTRWPVHRPLVRIAWEQIALPIALTGMNAQLIHGLVNVLPLACNCPGVVTVHDLSFLRTPDAFPTSRRLYLSALCRASTARAHKVIAVSQETADDLISLYSVEARKIEVVYNGVAQRYRAGSVAQNASARPVGLPERYMLYLGTLEPRKNLERLIEGYALWQRGAGDDVALVIAGARGWYYQQIFEMVRDFGLEDRVLFPGFISDEELPSWYRSAELFVYPSLFEGFGLPILEAMASGTPVLCSDAASLREVAGDAALFFERRSSRDLAAQIRRFYLEPGLRAALSRAGRERSAHFSWRRAAEETLTIYEDVLRHSFRS